MMTWAYGELPLVEHDGLWKSAPDDPDVTEDDYEKVYEAFTQFLDSTLTQDPRDRLCYVIGAFCGDRTQTLVFNDLTVLDSDLIRKLQLLLRQNPFRHWRIAIEAAIQEDWIMVYPGSVCTVRKLRDEELEQAIREIRDRELGIRRRREEERQARIEHVRPLLKEAYAEAMVRKELAYLVHTEICSGKDDGLVRMWVIHAMAEIYTDLRKYIKEPRAYCPETFSLFSDGSITEKIGRKPPEALFLALWEFEADESRTLRFEDGIFNVELAY